MPDLTVVYDANVLYPAPLRDLLIRLAQTGTVRARWTDAILDEVFRSILADRPDLKARDLTRTRGLMCAAVRDCLVTGYEPRISTLTLPDADDRHVLAAAIHCGAQAIVTGNTKDFPARTLAPLGVEAVTPDEFVLGLVESTPEIVLETVTRQADALKKPPSTVGQLLETLAKNGLGRAVAALRDHRRADGP